MEVGRVSVRFVALSRFSTVSTLGGGLKNDFEGHDNHWSNNVIAFPSKYLLHNGYGGVVGQPGKG
jgi:hypothetical protein